MIPNSGPKLSDLSVPHPRVNCLKTIPFKAAHTYIAHTWQYLLPRGLDSLCSVCIVEYRYVSHNTDAITGTLRLNRFDIADSLCCMYLIDRFSHLLRCEVALHFINT